MSFFLSTSRNNVHPVCGNRDVSLHPSQLVSCHPDPHAADTAHNGLHVWSVNLVFSPVSSRFAPSRFAPSQFAPKLFPFRPFPLRPFATSPLVYIGPHKKLYLFCLVVGLSFLDTLLTNTSQMSYI